MDYKISVLTVVNRACETPTNLINSFSSQSYPEKELLVMTNEELDMCNDVKVFQPQHSFIENIEFLVAQASGDYVIFMHPNEFFSENTVLEELMSKCLAENVDALVFSYMKLEEGKFYFHHYGDDVRVRPLYPSSVPILMNRYEEFRKWTGVLYKKELVTVSSENGQENLLATLTKADKILFDTKAYYVIPTHESNSLVESASNDVDLPFYVKKEISPYAEAVEGPINVAMCIDNNYGRYISPLLYSLHQHHETVNVYLIYADLNEEMFLLLMDLKRVLTHLNIKLKRIPKYMIEQLKNIQTIHTGLAISTYYRLFIPTLLPHVNRVLYMDVDMMVMKNLDELYYTSFEGNYLVAVNDLAMIRQENYWGTTLLGKYYKNYFNNGLLLMNLYLMRKNQHLSKLLKFIGENYLYFNHDNQDTFNLFYRGAVKYFPMTFNWMPYDYRFYVEKFEDLSIVHFCGEAAKPWRNHSYVDDNYTLLKNYYRCSKLAVDHLLNRQPRVAIFTDDTGIFNSEKHKVESFLMQLEANVEIYILFDERRVGDYLYDYAQLSPYIHLVAKKQKSHLQIMREILKKDVVDYVYCLYGMDYLEVEDAIYQLTSIAEDHQADVVFSTYKVLEVEKGLFYQYRSDNQIHLVKASDYEVYQKKQFSNLNSLQGTLIKTPIIESVLNENVTTEDEVMLKVISRSSRIYYKDSYFWIKKS